MTCGFAVFVIREEQAENESELKDYKFYCFYGAPEYCQVFADCNKNETIDFYDMAGIIWNLQGLLYRMNRFRLASMKF